MSDESTRVVANFGRNHVFQPRAVFEPASEAELLEILGRHQGRTIRAASRLHSWCEAVVCDDVMIDLRRLDSVEIVETPDGAKAIVGAGCQIKRLLAELDRKGWTLPSLGLITQQAIGGATATGTHGSGRNSLSHYPTAVRVANFDPETGEPRVRRIDSGPELEAARCSLGCLGVVTSVEIPVRKQYLVEEHFARHATLESVLAAEAEFPIQQFYWVPWRWDFFGHHRREVAGPRSSLAWLYRVYCSVVLDVALHLNVIPLGRWFPRWVTAAFYQGVLPLTVPRGWRVADRSDVQLTMGHHYFRHLETEIFVPRSRLGPALALFEWLMRHFGGERTPAPREVRDILEATGDWRHIEPLRGRYVHHYVICVRKVLPDDTLISASAGGDEPWYAVSFITYQHPSAREGFFQFAEIAVRAAAHAFGARPHWGKHCPVTREQVERLYPRVEEFRRIAKEADPEGRFANPWLRRTLLGD